MIVRIASLFPEFPKTRTSSNTASFPKKKRSCASCVEWNVSQGQNDWKRFPCLPRQPLSLATKIPLPTFPVLTNHYLQPSNRFYSAWPSYRSLPRLLLYIPHEGFDKDESLWEGGVGRGGRGASERPFLPPPFSKRSGAGTEEVVPTPFEERGDILRGMDVARTRPPSQGKEGEPGWRRKPGIRACITRRAAVKRPTRRLRRTESQGVNPVLPDHQQGSVDGPVFMETEAGRGGFPPSNHAVFAGPLKDA